MTACRQARAKRASRSSRFGGTHFVEKSTLQIPRRQSEFPREVGDRHRLVGAEQTGDAPACEDGSYNGADGGHSR